MVPTAKPSASSSTSSNSRSSKPPSSLSLRPHLAKIRTVGSAIGDKIPTYIPGYRIFAAFLCSLRANLRISDEIPPSSPTSRSSSMPPANEPTGAPDAAPPPPADPLADVPELSTFTATDPDDRHAALKLVADSVAQQRQTAARTLIAHPLLVAAFTAVAAVVGQFLYKTPGDLSVIFTTVAGLTMAALVAVRSATSQYLTLAEKIDWTSVGGEESVVVATRYGEQIIGALIMEVEVGEKQQQQQQQQSGDGKTRSAKKKKGAATGGAPSAAGGKGVVYGWTILLRYRGKGEGRALLEEAAKIVQQRGGDDLVFAEDNVYSKRVLPKMFNGAFDRRDKKAQDAIEKVVAQSGLTRKS